LGNVQIRKLGGGLRSLTDAGIGDYYGSPSWSPDGTKVAIDGYVDGLDDIYVVKVTGSTPRNLTPNTSSTFENDPSWSPDGKRIAFVTSRDGNDEIYVMSAVDGSGKTNVTRNAADDYDSGWGRK
jgi:Tol biopolymer transport system component